MQTAALARELRQYNSDIAVLSETHLTDKCQLSEVGAG